MKIVILPDGRRINMEGTLYVAAGAMVVFTTLATGKVQKYACDDGPAALAMVEAIDAFLAGADVVSADPVSSGSAGLSFVSISPDTALTTDPGYNGIITGTGFDISFESKYWYYTDGVWSAPGGSVVVNDPTSISLFGWGGFPSATDYSIFYMEGSTPVDTGLKIHVS